MPFSPGPTRESGDQSTWSASAWRSTRAVRPNTGSSSTAWSAESTNARRTSFAVSKSARRPPASLRFPSRRGGVTEGGRQAPRRCRLEKHTHELQPPYEHVCRHLLGKKNEK